LREYDASDIIKILIAASELSLQELIPHLQSFLIENEANWMEQNFNLIYQTSFENDSFLELQKFCTELISKEPEKIFKSSGFTSIPEKSLISLIQQGNLQMDGIKVWEYVLKWGIAQNLELSSDPTSYSKDDFNVLKNTLQQCIPLIKFYDLTSREFAEKVLPYKKIFPKELYKSLLNDFLNNDSKPTRKSELNIYNIAKKVKEVSPRNINSKIITFQHAELISKWIDRLEVTDKIHEFKLLFRGTRDGFLTGKFHEICDNRSSTVTILKVKGNSEIIGGYNPIVWRSDYCYGTTKDSFIFSFNDGINNYILSRVVDEQYAIYNGSLYGPSFGNGDIRIWWRHLFFKNSCKKASYEKPIREPEEFSIEEWEVFQVV
jgi:hypothetical protein